VPNSLSDGGWLVGANVFDTDGTTFLYDYFAFPAPNGGAGFSAVAVGEGGAEQGAQQLSIYNDYNNADHGLGRIIEAIVFRERTIVAGDVGTTLSFTFDAKAGNIEGASTALAFIKTLDPGAGFATTNFITEDTTNLPATWGTFTLSLPVDASLVGQTLQYGFQSRASNFEGSGVFYDNLTFGVPGCGGTGGPGIELRPLPEIYTTGTAINYGPYRAGGPGSEFPSDADLLEDLSLMDTAGYNLIRLFGADPVHERILQLAEANFPEMQFQQGLFLGGLAPGPEADNCDNADNDSQVATAIQLANTYSNVVTVSVGNETSFFSAFMPLNCLEGYITETRDNVTQPCTADDDYTFYANFFGRSPDGVLRLIDFVSIHTYPFINYQQWDWKQEAVPAGDLRAEAMMNASLAKAQQNYQAVYDYTYSNASGVTVTVGGTRPIVIGETGWKWRQTAPTQEIETYAANPVNAKWYKDLMQTWERSPGGPVTVMDFVAFDEAWKLTDDGWGFWNELRQPNYALCDTPAAGAPCNNPVYQGAGFFTP
jgi:exo-beta-1,3-glucanase (GH17 family)